MRRQYWKDGELGGREGRLMKDKGRGGVWIVAPPDLPGSPRGLAQLFPDQACRLFLAPARSRPVVYSMRLTHTTPGRNGFLETGLQRRIVWDRRFQEGCLGGASSFSPLPPLLSMRRRGSGSKWPPAFAADASGCAKLMHALLVPHSEILRLQQDRQLQKLDS